MKKLTPIFMIVLLLSAVMLIRPLPATAADYTLQDVMTGNIPGLNTEVKGSGISYYGDSIRVYFTNSNSQTYQVKVPVGMRLIPDDSSVQTMYTAGGESLNVPPGSSNYTIKAFCGEQHDSGPTSVNVFTFGGFADGELMRTLEAIHDQNIYTRDAQSAVWHQTDDNDITGNEIAQNLAGGGGVSPGSAAAAGGATAVAAIAAVIIMNLLNSGGTAVTDNLPGDGGPDISEVYVNNEPVIPPEGDFEEAPIPPENFERFNDYQTGNRSQLPPELQAPIRIAEIPPPEDPADGILIASNDENPIVWIIDKIREGGRQLTPEERERQDEADRNAGRVLRPMMFDKGDENESWWQKVQRYTGWGKTQTPEERDAEDEALRNAGRIARQNPAFGSDSQLQQALSDPVNYSQTGEGDPQELLRQVNREKYEEGGTKGIKIIRRLQNLSSLTNSKGSSPNFNPNPQDISPGNIKHVLTPSEVTRDLSGAANIGRDYIEPDAQDFIDMTGVYQKNETAHQAWNEYYDKYGSVPDPDNPAEFQKYMDIYNRLRGK